ncbi:MAG: MBL fold metallo-hydrolase [Clostridium sp.]|uniref:MBL fold metallo-hydrolase n=1 Tax=Clostridium sp. TaxID=1506 RepID=UPI003EE7E483
MKIRFLGYGGAFDDTTNSCAYFEYAEELYLIDCGENTFSAIKKLLDEKVYKRVNVLITHTHADHVNGLSTLSHYLYYIKKIPLDIKVHEDLVYSIERLMEINGNDKCQYNLWKLNSQNIISNDYGNFFFGYVRTKHVSNLDCFGILFRHENDVIYFSGDSFDVPDEIKMRMTDSYIAKLTHYYQDISLAHYEGNVHMSKQVFDEKLIPVLATTNIKVYFYHNNKYKGYRVY